MTDKKDARPTQRFVEIEAIRRGVVILKNGALRKIVMVSGVNFDLKSEEEQEVITYAYQNFLNSLDFSIQLLVHSRRLDTENYIHRLELVEASESSELLKRQLAEYREFIKSLVGQNDIMAKNFFAVIPYDPVVVPKTGARASGGLLGLLGKKAVSSASAPAEDPNFNAHLEQLRERTEQVLAGIRQIGLRAIPLEHTEVLELFLNLYNPAPLEKKQVEGNDKDMAGDALRDVIAPSALEINAQYIKIGDQCAKTLFLFAYPRYLSSGWFSPLINLPNLLDISIFIHPVDAGLALKNLRKKSAQIQAQLSEEEDKGLVRNPMLETAAQDVEGLRDVLQQGTERLFQTAVYITFYARDESSLARLESEITSLLESRMVYAKPAAFQALEGWQSSLPLGRDELRVTTPLNSGPLSSFFPFVSTTLTSNEGILYGVNRHNNTLIIFDRFSLENGNMAVFAKAGAGKSYSVKLEALRPLMTGTDVIIIDPENEYETLARSVGGSYFKVSLASESHINPFDIPVIPKDEEPTEVLKSHILNLTGLLKLMLGEVTDEEEALLDRAIAETYAAHDIVPGKDFSLASPPLLSDLQSVLENMEGGAGIATRLYKYTQGSYAGFTNQPSNVNMQNRLIVFSIRDLEDELRPIAMYIILNFIWNLVRAELKRRVMIIDEAWWMMKYPDGASFLFALAKRARKYYLGITTITQDVEDFINSPYGRPIITNSSLQLLLKQSPAMIETVGKTFNLTEAEKNLLLESDVGTGLFFAGMNHVAIHVVASFLEDKIVTTKPEELLNQERTG